MRTFEPRTHSRVNRRASDIGRARARAVVADWRLPGIILLLCAVVLILSAARVAKASVYLADIEDGQWQVDSSPIECRLTHPIPAFGEAVVSMRAGDALDFSFNTHTNLLPPGPASLAIEAPPWKPHLAGYRVSEVEVSDRWTPIHIAQPQAGVLVQSLLQGMMPTLVADDRSARAMNAGIKVSVSAVNFKPAYEQYTRCLTTLLPVNFAQISRSAIFYNTSSVTFGRDVKQQLDLIARYMKADAEVVRIFIDGHTDNTGTTEQNLLVSKQRAEHVAAYFRDAGIKADAIVTRYHGDRYPVQSNDTEEDRERNRRVTVRLERE